MTIRDQPQNCVHATDRDRLNRWWAKRDFVAIGNLGEHVGGCVLVGMGYHLLAAQDDLQGMVSDVLGKSTRAHPEDFVAIDPEGRLLTINSKASLSVLTCRILTTGNLSSPRLGRGQNQISYSTQRAGLITPLEGDSFAQVIKVDLLHLMAQVFDIEVSGKLTALGTPQEVAHLVQRVLKDFPDRIPPPTSMSFD